MDGTRDSHTKWSKAERKRQIPYDITYLWNLKHGTDDPIYQTETDCGQWEQTHGSQREGKGVGWTGSLGFLDANSYICNGWATGPYCTAQGTVCDWSTLLYSRNWRDFVNQLYFDYRKKKRNWWFLTFSSLYFCAVRGSFWSCTLHIKSFLSIFFFFLAISLCFQYLRTKFLVFIMYPFQQIQCYTSPICDLFFCSLEL